MPTLVAVDVSVTDNRLCLVFSHRAVAAAYAAYLRAQDLRPPPPQQKQQHQTIVHGYARAPRLHAEAKEVSVALPGFITWFITCRLPDDEDAVTFTFMDADEGLARRWAESMVLFELIPPSSPSAPAHLNDIINGSSSPSPMGDDGGIKQLQVRRLWNKDRLLKRLEELRRRVPTPPGTVVNGYGRSQAGKSRVASPVWGGQRQGEDYGMNGNYGSENGSGSVNGNGRVPVPVMGPMQARGDIWW